MDTVTPHAQSQGRVRCYLVPAGDLAASTVARAEQDGAASAKAVFFVRHGAGTHNQAEAEGSDAVYEDEAYFDAELVPEGLAQAAQAGVTLRGKGIQCVVASPLTRCLQTASIACANDTGGMGHAATRRVVVEHVRESCKYGRHPCNRRRAKEETAPRFPGFCFDGIEAGPDTVWALEQGKDGEGAMVQARARQFLEWLGQQPEDTFAVFTHCVFLHQLLDHVLDMQPCTDNWNPGKAWDGGCSWFDKGQVQGFVLAYPPHDPHAHGNAHGSGGGSGKPPASPL